ncbi:MAG: hypothetical protein MUC45_00400 [Actinomycetia bacterium]|nr:hypothetical protein [Actinomycetes bacterium]
MSRSGRARTLVVGGTVLVAALAAVLVAVVVGSGGSDADPVSGPTQFGASFQQEPAESYEEALARTDRTIGPLDVVRVFYQGEPDPWPGKAPGRSVVVSFKLDPRAVSAGLYDESMGEWFAAAPRDRDVTWVYWHEPEDDIEDGAFTAEEFRRAFAHLAGLAEQADHPRLRSAVVLMSYTLRPASGRDWRDYYPGDDVVDVFAWDVYNRRTDGYSPPEELLGGLRDVAESVGKPFAIGELGSQLADGDDGEGRAQWLLAVGDYALANGAPFVCYFDFVWNDGANDYRLRDEPSAAAWRQLTARAEVTPSP